MLPLKVAGLGVYLPERRETRDDFIRRGIPEDIIEELGVYERRIVADGQTAADMEVEAAKRALADANMLATDIDLIISSTILPDTIGVPNANLLQHSLGAAHSAAFDIGQACGSVIPGLIIAANFITLGQYKRILLSASTHWSVISDPSQPSADFVLGDAAAAVVLTSAEHGYGIISYEMQADGQFYQQVGTRVGCDQKKKYYDQHNEKMFFYIDEKGINGSQSGFARFLVAALPRTFRTALHKASLLESDIDCAVIHGNVNPLVEKWIKGMNIPPERFPLTYARYGNISAATVLVNLYEGLNRGMIKQGDTIALVAQGAGFSTGTIIMRWE